MTITLGRFGTDVNVTISRRRDSGGVVSLEGYIGASSLADSKVLRQQLNGLVDNPDEPVVPVACTDDTSLDGFYRVTRVSCDADSVSSVNFVLPFTCEMERAAPGYNPLQERTLLAALRTNSHGIVLTSTVAFFGVPINAAQGSNIATAFSTANRTGADGQTVFFYDDNPSASSYVNSFALNPSENGVLHTGWYDNAVQIQSKWADATNYRAVVGRHVPAYVGSGLFTGSDWRMSNGFVRITPAETSGASNTGCDINVEHWDGTAWDTAKRYTFTIEGNSLASSRPMTQSIILRNDGAAGTIRIAPLINNRAWLLDLTLRRGSRFVECRWTTDVAGDIIVARQATEAATALTGGIRATSNDASSNRFVLSSPHTVTTDLVNGKLTRTAATEMQFMIGSEIAGSAATGQDTAQNQVYQYMCAQAETYRVVGR